MNVPAMLPVILYTLFATALFIVEYSFWKEQDEIVVDTFIVVGAVTIPKALGFVHWLAAAPQDEQAIVVIIQLEAVPHELLVFQWAK